MAGNYMYKPIKSSTKSRKTFIAHKQWTITDETAPTFNVQKYFGRFSNGSFSLGDINDTNIASEPQTNGKYDRIVFNSTHHIYYRDPESAFHSSDPQYFKQQDRNLHKEVHLVSIPSGLFGDRINEHSVTMSNASTTIHDDGVGNIRDASILALSGFVTQSKDDYFIKVDFNDGWKLQNGNYEKDQTFRTSDIQLIDISNGPYEAYGCEVSFEYHDSGLYGISGSSFIKTNGSSSLIGNEFYTSTASFDKPKPSSFIRIDGTQDLASNKAAYDNDFSVSLRVKLPPSQSVTSSYTGPYENPNGNGYRTLKDHTHNVLVTSRQWSSRIPWELSVYNQNTTLNGKIFFTRGTTGNTTTITSSSPLSDSDWHSVVIQKSGSFMQMYVDGTLQASKADPIDGVHLKNIRTDIHIGARKWGKQFRERQNIPKGLIATGDGNFVSPPVKFIHKRENNYIYPSSASFDQFKLFKKALNANEVTSLNTYLGRDNNIIGNVFYNHGIITITDMSSSYDSLLNDYTLYFNGTRPIDVHNYRCIVENGDFNVSLNPTLRKNHDMNNDKLKGFASASHFNPYITTIGLYNDGNELLAIGKLAYPIRSPQELDITFNVQFDT